MTIQDTSYNEEIDEFAPAKPAGIAKPAAPEPPAAPAAPTAPVAPEPHAAPVAPEPHAAPAAPEPPANAYDSIITQQTEQINALIAQNQSLTNQITQLIQSGAQINQGNAPASNPMQQAMMNPSLQNQDDWSLESLAKEIGKKAHR